MAQIDFASSREFLEACKWVTDIDPQTLEASVLRYTLLKITEDGRATLTGWSLNGTCLQRHIPAGGQLDVGFLFDGADLNERCGRNKAFADVSLRLESTRGNSVRVKAVTSVVEGEAQSYAHINVGCYVGGTDEFPQLEILEEVVGTISQRKLAEMCFRANLFSKLKTEKCERHMMLRFVREDEPLVYMYSAEPGGRDGFSHLCQWERMSILSDRIGSEVSDYEEDYEDEERSVVEEVRVCFFGHFVQHISEVSRGGEVEIRLDSLEEPKVIQFIGDRGSVTIKLELNRNKSQYLEQTAYYNFHGHPTVPSEVVSQRAFSVGMLGKCVESQKPKKGSTRRDLRLEQTGISLQISKVGDTSRSERAVVENLETHLGLLEQEWATVSANYDYLLAGIVVCERALQSIRSREDIEQNFDFDEEDDGYFDEPVSGGGIESGEITRGQGALVLELMRVGAASRQKYLLKLKPEGCDLIVSVNALGASLSRADEE